MTAIACDFLVVLRVSPTVHARRHVLCSGVSSVRMRTRAGSPAPLVLVPMLRVRVRLACSPFAVQSAGWVFVSCEYVLDRRLSSRRQRQASAWSAPGHVGPPVAQGRLLDARRCDDGMCVPACAPSSARGDGERGGVPPCIRASVRAPFRACNLLRDRDRQVGQSVASACRQSFVACPDASQDTVVSIPAGAFRDSSACATFPVVAGHGTGTASVTLHSRRSSSRCGSSLLCWVRPARRTK
ncbi:hypothetical protein ERJ75_001805600 [Trypanosoma vivax]|nr:hypothetical protein ERJ75_001805600 [Trypanosoma vivax]